VSESDALEAADAEESIDALRRRRGLRGAQLNAFIRDRTGGCKALGDAWPRSEWESARKVQAELRPSTRGPGAFYVRKGIPPWLRAALRGVPLLKASHCAFPAWFAVASPLVDWFALADAQPDLRVTSDVRCGAPSIDDLRGAARLAAEYSGRLVLHVVLAPISEAAEVEAIVVGVALTGAGAGVALLPAVITDQLGFGPSRRLTFSLPPSTEPTLLAWEWGDPLLNVPFGSLSDSMAMP